MNKRAPIIRNSSILNSPLIICVLFLSAAGISVGAYNLFFKGRLLTEQMQARAVVRDSLEETHQKLLNDVSFIESERGQEEAIRRQFDVVREGESLVIIPIPNKKNKETVAPDNSVQPQTIWQKLIFWQ